MRVFIIGLTAVLLAGCSPPAEPTSDPGLKPAVSATSETMSELSSAIVTSTSADAGQCSAEIGEAAAQKLADRCRMVSPATHPPCNVANSCQMIQDEIDRSCAMWDKDTSQPKPKECTA